MSGWTESDIRQFEENLPPEAKEPRLTSVKVMVGLNVETDRLLDQIAERCSVGRSEVVRQLIVVGDLLLRTPYDDPKVELDTWHAIRSLRAQLGDQTEYRKEYHNG